MGRCFSTAGGSGFSDIVLCICFPISVSPSSCIQRSMPPTKSRLPAHLLNPLPCAVPPAGTTPRCQTSCTPTTPSARTWRP